MDNPHLYSLANLSAPSHCRIAQRMIISGATIAQNMNSKRRKAMLSFDSPGSGIFGWTDTHAQENIVPRQLQTISHVDRWGVQLHCCWSMANELIREFLLFRARVSKRGAASLGLRKKTMAARSNMGHISHYLVPSRTVRTSAS